MTEIDLTFLARQNERILEDFAQVRADRMADRGAARAATGRHVRIAVLWVSRLPGANPLASPSRYCGARLILSVKPIWSALLRWPQDRAKSGDKAAARLPAG